MADFFVENYPTIYSTQFKIFFDLRFLKPIFEDDNIGVCYGIY
jgi:hypothetical protein